MPQNTDLLVADIGGTNARFAISDGDGALAGAVMIVGGIAITPVGWVLFGTSLRPKVEVTPLGR